MLFALISPQGVKPSSNMVFTHQGLSVTLQKTYNNKISCKGIIVT